MSKETFETNFDPSKLGEEVLLGVETGLRQQAQDLEKAIRQEMKRRGLMGATNELIDSVTSDVTRRGMRFTVVAGTGARYGFFVHEGTRPHWIGRRGMDSLKLWAKRKLGDEKAAWAVRWKIGNFGTEPNPYLNEPFRVAQDDIPQFIADKLQEELGGE